LLFLVVDDDALSRELLTLLLDLEGYAVEAVASGEEAISRMASSSDSPDVILADIQMPGIAGDALARALRPSMPPGTLLFAMSGSRPEADATRCFDGFLLKPFKITELQSMISEGKALAGGRKDPVTETSVAESAIPSAAAARAPGKRAHGKPDAAQSDGILDEEIYSKLSDLMPVEQLGQMYAMCIEDSRQRITRMKTLAAAGDDAAFRSEAHAVKGGCGMIGAKEIYGLAEAAENDGIACGKPTKTAAKPGKTGAGTSGVTAALDRLSLACDRLERILVARTRA